MRSDWKYQRRHAQHTFWVRGGTGDYVCAVGHGFLRRCRSRLPRERPPEQWRSRKCRQELGKHGRHASRNGDRRRHVRDSGRGCRRRLLVCLRWLCAWARQPLAGHSGLLTGNRGPLWNRGLLAGNCGLLAGHGGSLRNSGLFTRSSGLRAGNSGLFTRSSGLFTRSSGLRAGNSGLRAHVHGSGAPVRRRLRLQLVGRHLRWLLRSLPGALRRHCDLRWQTVRLQLRLAEEVRFEMH